MGLHGLEQGYFYFIYCKDSERDVWEGYTVTGYDIHIANGT
jgi:hypothetical protein